MQRLTDVPQAKQMEIIMDIKRYLKGELKMSEIIIKHEVTSFITQKLLRREIGFDTKHNQL